MCILLIPTIYLTRFYHILFNEKLIGFAMQQLAQNKRLGVKRVHSPMDVLNCHHETTSMAVGALYSP